MKTNINIRVDKEEKLQTQQIFPTSIDKLVFGCGCMTGKIQIAAALCCRGSGKRKPYRTVRRNVQRKDTARQRLAIAEKRVFTKQYVVGV